MTATNPKQVDAELLARILRMQERFDDACQQIAQAFVDIPEEQGMEKINRAIHELRNEQEKRV